MFGKLEWSLLLFVSFTSCGDLVAGDEVLENLDWVEGKHENSSKKPL